MSFTVFLGNLPTWVTADDIKQWLAAEDLVADAVKVIRNHETQESKGFAFVEAPTADEMQAIIRSGGFSENFPPHIAEAGRKLYERRAEIFEEAEAATKAA